ncbi:MAG: ATP-binding protein [Deltaproteobacteria bacterium]|nr:ATP-binding protein [Deltaproteobacteria bacterium]
MEDLSLHILDVAENGITAGASLVRITVEEDTQQDRLSITVEDNGRGMAPDFLAKALDPFVTTRTTRKVGMGLSLLQQTAAEADGDLKVESSPGRGTTVRATMRHSHIDRKPLGDMAVTMITLIEGNPDVDFTYLHRKDGNEFSLDTRDLREELEEVPLNNPAVIEFIRKSVASGLKEINAG